MLRVFVHIRSKVEEIVHWLPEVLFAAEIAFGGLDRSVPKQELYLFKLPAAIMTELRTGSPQIVWRNVLQASFPAARSDDVPNDVLR